MSVGDDDEGDELDSLEYIDLTDLVEEDIYVYHHRGIFLQSPGESDESDEDDDHHNDDINGDVERRRDPQDEIFKQLVELLKREHSLDEFMRYFDRYTSTHNVVIDINRISPEIGTTLFFHALRCHRLDIARFLIEMGADVMHSRPWSPSMYMDVVLLNAMDEETESETHRQTQTLSQTDNASRTLEKFKLLIEGCRFDVNACVSAEEGAAKSLLGAVLEQFSAEGEVVRFLLRHGADVEYKHCNSSGLVSIADIALDWALSLAVIQSIYHRLRERAQAAMIRKVYELNQCALAGKEGNIFLPMARARFLLKLFMSSPNHREYFDVQMFSQSLKITAAHCSKTAYDFQQDMLQVVVESASRLFDSRMMPLIARVDTFLSLHSLAEHVTFDIDTRGDDGRTALHNIVSRADDYLLLSLLLNVLGADPNIADDNGTTPLITACLLRHHNAIQLLLHSGARVDVWNAMKQNAFFLSIQAKDADLVRMIANEFPPTVILALCHPLTERTALEEANLCGEIAVVNILTSIFHLCQAL